MTRNEFEKLSIIKLGLIWLFFTISTQKVVDILEIKDVSLITILAESIILLFVFYMIKKNSGKLQIDFSVFKIKKIKRELIKLYVINFVLSLALVVITKNIIQMISPSNMEEILNDTAVTGNGILTFMLAVIVAPIYEEVIYRGVVFTKISKKFNFVIAMIISSALFAYGHIDVHKIGAFCFGITACILFVKYKNILVNISLHMLNNFIIFIISFGSDNNQAAVDRSKDVSNLMGNAIFVLILSLIAFAMYIKNNKEVFNDKESDELRDAS